MNTDSAREQMINQQLRTWDVLSDRVLGIVRNTPREQFVLPEYADLAFADFEVPIGLGQHMLTPKLEGRLLQALALQSGDNVLQIGTGSGFVCACLAGLAARVTSYEQHAALATAAEDRLKVAGRIGNVDLHAETFSEETPGAEYDAIAVCGSVSEVNATLKNRLAIGGRLFVISGRAPVQRAELITKIAKGDFRCESLFDTVLAPLVGFEPPERFLF